MTLHSKSAARRKSPASVEPISRRENVPEQSGISSYKTTTGRSVNNSGKAPQTPQVFERTKQASKVSATQPTSRTSQVLKRQQPPSVAPQMLKRTQSSSLAPQLVEPRRSSKVTFSDSEAGRADPQAFSSPHAKYVIITEDIS